MVMYHQKSHETNFLGEMQLKLQCHKRYMLNQLGLPVSRVSKSYDGVFLSIRQGIFITCLTCLSCNDQLLADVLPCSTPAFMVDLSMFIV